MLPLLALAALTAPAEATFFSSRQAPPPQVTVDVHVDVTVDAPREDRPRPRLFDYRPPPVQIVGEAELYRLTEAVEDATWGDDQVDLISGLARGRHFTCEQVLALIEPISFSDDRLDAVQALRSSIVDPQDFYVLYEAFPFSSDRRDLSRMF